MRKIIELKADRKVEKKVIKGIEFLVSLSPYFFPRHLECDYDEKSGCFVIHFKYLDEEPSRERREEQGAVSLEVGKHSGRLLAMHVHVDKHDVDAIRMLIKEEVPKVLKKAMRDKPDLEESYDQIEEALVKHGAEIAAAVPA